MVRHGGLTMAYDESADIRSAKIRELEELIALAESRRDLDSQWAAYMLREALRRLKRARHVKTQT